MTYDEHKRRVMALDVMLLAATDPRAETKIAELLGSWLREERESNARACLYVAKEWQEMPADLSELGRDLRQRSADAAKLCASRIAPGVGLDEKPQDPEVKP